MAAPLQPTLPPPRSRVYIKAIENAGKPFEAGRAMGSVQMGVDPNTLIPAKDLSTLKANDIASAAKYAGNKCIQVSRDGVIQQGHHRLTDAINNGRAVDVKIV